MLCADGTALVSGATVWAAGFAVTPIAAVAGLEVTGHGQIVVDRTMRSVSDPNVYAIGDSVHAIGDNGRPLPMSCASAGHTGRQAIEAIVGRLTGRTVATTELTHTYNLVSLGRRDGILQTFDEEGQAKPHHNGGWMSAHLKAGVLTMALWATRHPTYALPRRRHRLAGEFAGAAQPSYHSGAAPVNEPGAGPGLT